MIDLHAQNSPKSIIFTGGTIYTAAERTIENGAIGIKGDSISYVGLANESIEKEYERVVEIEGKHVYPGLIAMNTTLGLTEIFSVRATRDYREVGDMNPNVRSIIAYNAESDITSTVLENGVLFAQICPRGGTISGTSSVVKLKGWNWEDAVYQMDEGISMKWPSMFKRKGEKEDPREYREDENYTNEMIALRDFFAEAQAYSKSKYPEKRDLRLEAMRGIFDGTKRLYVEANFIKEIREVIAFKRKLNLQKVTIVGGYEASLVSNLLAENNMSVLVQRVLSLPRMAEDHIDASFLLPSQLAKSDVLFAFQMDGDMEPIQNRNITYAAGVAIANGLDPQEALKALTIYPARICGIDERTGSLEVGKKANFIITKGDLFDIRTGKVLSRYLEGKLIQTENRQNDLYEKYLQKYSVD